MTRKSSQKQNRITNNYCIQRDGLNCLFCEIPIPKNQACVIDHLNDNPLEDRLENRARCHQKCNIDKINNFDYQILADTKRRNNLIHPFIPKEDNESEEMSSEIKISKSNFDITEENITERILVDGFILWHDALYGSVYKCKKITGYGSVQCVRNYLYTLTSEFSPFMKAKNEKGKSIITKRCDN